jgi:hypothetical protein
LGVQRFFAQNWPVRLWMGIVPFTMPAVVCWLVRPVPWLLAHWLNIPMFAGILILAWVLGWYVAILVGWFVLGPLYYGQALRNGAPFRVGESVRLLTGPHAGRVVRVYEIWAERNEIRVDLGEQARDRVEDVYAYVQVCREAQLHQPLR